MIRSLALGALLVASGALAARAQIAVHVVDAGPVLAARVLRAALSGPHEVIGPDSTPARIARGSVHVRSVVVIGRDVMVDGRVEGDLTAIGGNVFMHPGGNVQGRVVAIGGGVYESSLAVIGAGIEDFRDFTYDVRPAADGLELRYRVVRETPVAVASPLGIGFVTPSYDRSNGLSLGLGPDLDVPRWSTGISARGTYRSQLGAWDPSLSMMTHLGARASVHVDVRRGTFTNDGWIWPGVANSVQTLVFGDDARNYYRGTRGRVSLDWAVNRATMALEPFIAFSREWTGSVRPSFGAGGGPWSIAGRHAADDMLRPNPPVTDGTLTSAHAGLQLNWSAAGVIAHAAVDEELGVFSPRCGGCGVVGHADFDQTTMDGFISFPAFLDHTVRFDLHGVRTAANADTPGQRLVYIGGPGTIPTESMLSQGGDELLFVDARYEVPVHGVALPLLGAPSVALRNVLGGVAVRHFPRLTQLTGVRLAAGFLYADLLIDPASKRGHASFGLTVGR